MIHTKPFFTNSQHHKLEYFNTIGLIFQNHIYLNRNNVSVQYDIADIKRVIFKKQRNLNQNCLLFVISLFIAFYSHTLGIILGNFKLFGFLVSGSFLVYSFLRKSYNYHILLLTVNQNTVSLSIKPECKKQATKLVTLINNKIKNDAQYLKVS